MDFASRVAYPVLGSYGGTDQGIPESAVQELRNRLDQAGVEHNLKIYEGAPHSFFDRMQADYAEASSDAWRRMLAFIQTGHPQN